MLTPLNDSKFKIKIKYIIYYAINSQPACRY